VAAVLVAVASAAVAAAVGSVDSAAVVDSEVAVRDEAGKGANVKPKDTAAEFAAELQRSLGGVLHSVMLYGSAVRGEWIPGVSDINVLVLVDDINGATLVAASPVVRAYARKHVHPIVVERKEWSRATDVFAIEIADMQDANEQLYGESALSATPVALPILRLQAERELRGKLLQIYLGMLVAESPEHLGALLMSTMPSLTTYFRTALRLNGRAVPHDAESVVRDGCEVIRADATPLFRILSARTGEGDLAVTLNDPLVDAYNTVSEQLVQFIDHYGR
jgi:predicted nucleotidyltransferase